MKASRVQYLPAKRKHVRRRHGILSFYEMRFQILFRDYYVLDNGELRLLKSHFNVRQWPDYRTVAANAATLSTRLVERSARPCLAVGSAKRSRKAQS
jgi:hypothetical protein